MKVVLLIKYLRQLADLLISDHFLTLAFTLADSLIIHSALLEPHSKSEIICKKGIFVTDFPFFNRLTQNYCTSTPPGCPPPYLMVQGQNTLSLVKVFC